jgi:hypothetical protein
VASRWPHSAFILHPSSFAPAWLCCRIRWLAPAFAARRPITPTGWRACQFAASPSANATLFPPELPTGLCVFASFAFSVVKNCRGLGQSIPAVPPAVAFIPSAFRTPPLPECGSARSLPLPSLLRAFAVKPNAETPEKSVPSVSTPGYRPLTTDHCPLITDHAAFLRFPSAPALNSQPSTINCFARLSAFPAPPPSDFCFLLSQFLLFPPFLLLPLSAFQFSAFQLFPCGPVVRSPWSVVGCQWSRLLHSVFCLLPSRWAPGRPVAEF